MDQKDALDNQQSQLILDLTAKYKEKDDLDRQQSETIEKVQVQLTNKDKLDVLQSSVLDALTARVAACEARLATAKQSTKDGKIGKGLGLIALVVSLSTLGVALFALLR